MIWNNLGFQAAAIAALVAAIAFVVPLPGERANSPPDSSKTSAQNASAVSAQDSRRHAVQNTNTGSVSDTRPASDAGFSPPQNAIPPQWSAGPEHDAEQNAAHHWQKHGSEFRELHSEQDYTNAAHDFVNHPPPGAETKHDSRGNTLIYDPQSDTFAVKAPNGAPRTMFRPRNGRAYWDRQH
jgi:hypothetical protein